ncbi:hypothetical protein F4778DRAFT_787699 [Xylariomycetidae sp. FL2044]|nr:hypothetical protein F4778DRAFT_787699 [Xylariomycetidae sp. FL2044]
MQFLTIATTALIGLVTVSTAMITPPRAVDGDIDIDILSKRKKCDCDAVRNFWVSCRDGHSEKYCNDKVERDWPECVNAC